MSETETQEKQQPKNLIEYAVRQAYNEWSDENLEGLVDRVKTELDDHLNDIVAKVLGMNNRWGKWEVDNCNGRSGQSHIGQEINTKATEVVADIVNEVLAGWKPSSEMKRAILDSFEMEIERTSTRRARDQAQRAIEEVVDESLSAVLRDASWRVEA
jgi:hypothetical protein